MKNNAVPVLVYLLILISSALARTDWQEFFILHTGDC